MLAAAVLVQPAPASPAAAALAPAPKAAVEGQATEYGPAAGGGACGFPGPPADKLVAAVGPALYDASAACGTYLEVTGAKGSVLVKVQDLCPECAPHHIDLSEEAFRRVDDLAKGLVPVTFRTVADPPVPGPVTVTMKEGVSQWWVSFVVDNHGNELTEVAVRPAGGSWQSMTRHEFNFWESSGDVREPFAVRITDSTGASSELQGLYARPGASYGASEPAAPSPEAPVRESAATTPAGTLAPAPTTPSATPTPTPPPSGSAVGTAAVPAPTDRAPTDRAPTAPTSAAAAGGLPGAQVTVQGPGLGRSLALAVAAGLAAGLGVVATRVLARRSSRHRP